MPEFFPGLRESEHIIFLIRKHWVAYVKILFKIILQLGLAMIMASQLVDKLDPNTAFFNIMSIFLVFFLMAGWIWMFIRFLDEDFDTIVVTNERLINTTQSKFLSISTSSCNLDQIQDVRGSVAGFFGGLFKFGNLDIQTAGKEIVFEMDFVEEPERYIDQIVELKENFMRNGNGR